MNSLDIIHKMTDTIKNIDKIEMLEESGYSENSYGRGYSRDGGEWRAEGSYNDGNSYRGASSYEGDSSYARRGQHYVRGHYSRDNRQGDYSQDGYSERDGYSRNYSRDEGKDMMMKKIDKMLGEAKTPSERELIKQCIEVIENS